MANTVVTLGIFTQITAMDGDYDHGKSDPIHSIKFYPGAADDELVIFEQSVAGTVLACKLVSADGEPKVEYFDGNPWWPVIDFSACTLTAGYRIVIVRDRFRK